MTNKKLEQDLQKRPGKSIGNRYLVPFSLMELYGFLGLLILNGVFRCNKEPITELYSEDPNKSKPVFKAAMPRERLKALLRYIRFDDYSSRLERLQTDN